MPIGHVFSIKDGIRAHIQHLRAYGSKKPLKTPCIDPRFDIIARGTAKFICDLQGQWKVENQCSKALEKRSICY